MDCKVRSIWPRLHLRALESGNVLGNLYPTHTRFWWPLVEDVFSSPPFNVLERRLVFALEEAREYTAISLDGTLKICMRVKGQEQANRSSHVRNSAPFGDDVAHRRVLTVRGRTGAVLAMSPVPSEESDVIAAVLAASLSPEARAQVQYVATDAPSRKLCSELQDVCPSLKGLTLDPVHLAIKYEYASANKRTAGSKTLRLALQRMTRVDTSLPEFACIRLSYISLCKSDL